MAFLKQKQRKRSRTIHFTIENVIGYPREERRRLAYAKTDAGRVLFMVYTERKNRVRPICVRPAHKSERKQYYEKTKTNP